MDTVETSVQPLVPVDYNNGTTIRSYKVVGCANWDSPFSCPLTLYMVIVIINVLTMLYTITDLYQKNGFNKLTNWNIGTLVVYLVISVLLGWWLNRLCQRCENGTAWGVFALLFLLQLVVFGGIITEDKILKYFGFFQGSSI